MIEDAVQDVFLVVHRRWADFAGRSSVKTWLYGIVLRVAKDYRRAVVRHANRVERLAEHLSSDPTRSSSPVDEAERREANRALHTLLSVLGDAHREVFVLVELEQLSVRDAAATLGIHVRACQRRLRAARIAFDAELANYLQPAERRSR